MTAATFVRSLFALRHYFPMITQAGLEDRPFSALQALGLAAERRMLRATGGVNTHRGAVFALGLLCAASGNLHGKGKALTPQLLRECLQARWGEALHAQAAAALTSAPVSHGQIAARAYGLRSALQEAGCYEPTLEWLNPASSSLALGGVMFEQIMGQTPAVDAIFFCNDDLAQGALMAAMRLGVSVPSQVAIAGFNDLTGSDQMLPALTTVRTPRAQIGEAAARMLLQLMRGDTPAQTQVDLGFEVVHRGSS
jgi:ABC-type sugar transport system substrate-binding protein